MVTLFGAAYYAAPNKGTTILYWNRSPQTLLIPPVNGKIQGLFKAFKCFSSTFQGKFIFQRLFKTVLYIQVLFKHVRTLDPHCMRGSRKFYQRGSNFDNVFFSFLVDEGRADPNTGTTISGLLSTCRWCPYIKCWLGSFVIFQGPDPLFPPSRSPHVLHEFPESVGIAYTSFLLQTTEGIC